MPSSPPRQLRVNSSQLIFLKWWLHLRDPGGSYLSDPPGDFVAIRELSTLGPLELHLHGSRLCLSLFARLGSEDRRSLPRRFKEAKLRELRHNGLPEPTEEFKRDIPDFSRWEAESALREEAALLLEQLSARYPILETQPYVEEDYIMDSPPRGDALRAAEFRTQWEWHRDWLTRKGGIPAGSKRVHNEFLVSLMKKEESEEEREQRLGNLFFSAENARAVLAKADAEDTAFAKRILPYRLQIPQCDNAWRQQHLWYLGATVRWELAGLVYLELGYELELEQSLPFLDVVRTHLFQDPALNMPS